MDTSVSTKDWLEDLAGRNTSEDLDNIAMQNLLRKLNFPNAVVVCGIVYFEGHGTMEYPPVSIHSVAKTILKVAAKQKAAKEAKG